MRLFRAKHKSASPPPPEQPEPDSAPGDAKVYALTHTLSLYYLYSRAGPQRVFHMECALRRSIFTLLYLLA